MASKWLKGKEKLFNDFKEQKKQESENNAAGPRRKDIVWKTPEKGTQEKPKNYVGRFLPDKNGNFYKSFLYHMFKNAKGTWTFVLCPKTHGMDKYCPLCAATMKLYKGTKEDKSMAYNYKRKSKHCGNWFVVKDPRDADAGSEDEKVQGKDLVYEFPDKVEQKVKSEMTDEEYGQGMNIFDPGEDGVDFLLKVGATKPDQNGNTYHDYSESKFTTKPYPLAKTDEEIQKIMDSTHDLDEYLKAMERSEEELIEIVKDEMLWELIQQDYANDPRFKDKPGPTQAQSVEEMDEPGFDANVESEAKPEPTTDQEESKSEDSDDSGDIDDDALLEELNSL